MMSKKGIILLLALLLTGVIRITGQTDGTLQRRGMWEDSMISLFARSKQTADKKELARLNDSLAIVLKHYIETDSPFEHSFSEVRFLGQITSPDSLVKLITWNLSGGEGEIIYNLYVVTRDYLNSKPGFRYLKAKNGTESIAARGQLTDNEWYGALYYDLRPFLSNGRRYYMLIGIDFFTPSVSRKFVEIAQIVGDELKLGVPLISVRDSMVDRMIFRYSSSVSMTLRFHAMDTLVFDHLSPRDSLLIGDYRFYGPDFSYDALIFDGNSWKLIEDFDARNRY